MGVPARGGMCKEYHGYAAKDNNEKDRYLYVYCEEMLPFYQGDDQNNLDGVEIAAEISTSGNAGAYQSRIKTSNAFKCLYRDESSSGQTPPLVRKGEQVIIYNFGDSDTWYWKSEGRNDNNRRTDLWRKAISGTLENAPELNDDNSYYIEMDTRKTHRIRISTSKQDNEEFRYLFMFDADASQVHICDDNGNQILIDSKEHVVAMKNTDNSLLRLDKENIVIMAKNDITIVAESGKINTKSGDSTTFDSGATLTTKSASDTINQSGATLQQTAASSWSLNFQGGGTMNSGGGNVGFKVGHFDVSS